MATAAAIVFALVLAGVGALVLFNAVAARYAELLVPRVGKVLTVDGVRVHYVDVGSGPVIFMLHGLASQLQTYTYALTTLLEDRYRLIVIDRPGAGYSQAAGSATLGAQAALFSSFLRALGVDRVLVVGHSLGGALALALALDHPEQVCGLALLAPATQPQSALPPALRRFAIRSDLVRWLLAWTVAAPLAMRGGRSALVTVFAPDPVPPDFGTRGGAILSMRPANFRNASRDLVEAGGEFPAYAARYASVTQPVGILFGAGDRILDHALHGEALTRQIPGSTLELIDDGGHMTPITSPERAATFIDGVAVRAGLRSIMAATEVPVARRAS